MLMINGEIQTLPLLKRAVQFEVASDYIHHDPKTGRKGASSRLGIPNEYYTIDEKGTPTHYRYYTQAKPREIKGEIHMEYLVNGEPDVGFVRGAIWVQENQPDLYAFLTNNPVCASNPKRDKDKIARFYEIKPQEMHKERVVEGQLIYEAYQYVYDSQFKLTDEQLCDILSSYGEPNVHQLGSGSKEEKMKEGKSKLLDYIEGKRNVPKKLAGPQEFLRRKDKIGSPDLRAQTMVRKALDLQVLHFNSSARDWEWGINSSNEGGNISRQPAGTSGLDWFVNHILHKDTTGVLHEIERCLENAENLVNTVEDEDDDSEEVSKRSPGNPEWREQAERTKLLTKEIKEAQKLFVAGQYQRAISKFENSMEINPQETGKQKEYYELAEQTIAKCKEQLAQLAEANA